MVNVPSAARYGFRLELNDDVMRGILNSDAAQAFVAGEAAKVGETVVSHIQATASTRDAANYVESMFFEDTFSDEYGFDFAGPYSLGDRPVSVVGVRRGRGVDPAAKPPMLLEAEHHALTVPRGVAVGGAAEDIR